MARVFRTDPALCGQCAGYDQPPAAVGAHLLRQLTDQWGLGRRTLVSMLKVPEATFHTWRYGQAICVCWWQAMCAVIDLLHDLGQHVANPAGWLEDQLPLPAGYLIYPHQVYRLTGAAGVLKLARAHRDPGPVLDRLMPGWRQRRSRWQVITAPDGHRAICPIPTHQDPAAHTPVSAKDHQAARSGER